MRAAACLSVAWLACIGGCRVGPDYREAVPPAGAASPWSSLEPSSADANELPDEWWKLYQDPTLDALVLEALRANADLTAAQANLAQARAVLVASRAALYPATTIELQGTNGRDPTTDEILGLDGHPPRTVWLLGDLFQAAYEVDLFGRTRRTVEAARAGAEAQAAARDGVRIVVAAETTRAYAEVCALGEELAVEQHSVALATREADITLNRHEVGANSEFDVERARVLAAQARSRVPPLEGERQAALFDLAALLGRTPAHAPREILSCVAPPRLPAPIPAGDGAALLRRRPDVRRAERELAAATASIGIATADLYPKITLGGFYGAVGFHGSDLTAERGLAWGVGPTVSWSFPNQSSARARVAQARAGAAAALARFDSVVLTALKETEQALTLYAAELARREALVEARERAERAFETAHEGFVAGAISTLDLLTAEQTRIATEEAIAESDRALIIDQVNVFKALGGGWRSSVPSP
jgi:NodT family efflux transporter outer membrane factor (OMF) lipoprotein